MKTVNCSFIVTPLRLCSQNIQKLLIEAENAEDAIVEIQEKTKSKAGYYIVGSIVLCIIALVLVPKIINAAASCFYRKKTHSVTEDDEWNPEVVKKEEVDK